MKVFQVGWVAALLVAVALSGCLGGGGSSESLRADFTVTQQNDTVFLFDATNSTGDIVEYAWNFGDGTTLEPVENRKVEMEYTITNAKPWVSLVVTAADGQKAMSFKQVTLGSGENTAPRVQTTQTPRWVTPGGDVVLDISQTSDPDGDGFTTEWFLGRYIDPAPPEAALDTGVLDLDQTFTQTFTEQGVYLINCGPHPWMTGRIVVDSDAQSSNATLGIWNFAFNDGEDFVIPPGTEVTIVNRDPVPHTATNYFAMPGAKKQEPTAKTFRVTGLDAGDYQAFAVVDDKKPGFPGTYSWGLRFSDDAPKIAFGEPVASGQAMTQADGAESVPFPSTLEYRANITAELTYSPLPLVDAAWIFEIVGPSTITGECASGSCTAIGSLPPGDYTFAFQVADGGVSQWSLSVKSFVYYADPGFGDPA